MNTDQPILKELNQRKSIREFLPKEIEPEKLNALWAAAQWAPSSTNKQEWHYYAVMGQAREKLAGVLSPGNQWALKAPLLLCVTRNISVKNGSGSREYGMYDVALSVMSLVIEAEHQGLRTRQMGGFNEETFRHILKIPSNEAPVVMVAVGYEKKTDEFDQVTPEKEMRPRVRKQISDIVTIVKNL